MVEPPSSGPVTGRYNHVEQPEAEVNLNQGPGSKREINADSEMVQTRLMARADGLALAATTSAQEIKMSATMSNKFKPKAAGRNYIGSEVGSPTAVGASKAKGRLQNIDYIDLSPRANAQIGRTSGVKLTKTQQLKINIREKGRGPAANRDLQIASLLDSDPSPLRKPDKGTKLLTNRHTTQNSVASRESSPSGINNETWMSHHNPNPLSK